MEVIIRMAEEDFNAIRYGHGLYMIGHDRLDDIVTEAFEQATILPEDSPTGNYVSRNVLDEIKQLYKEYQPNLVTEVIEFGNALEELIDNVPAVEYSFLPQYQADLQCAYDCGYEKGKQDRPKGKWLHNSDRPDTLICSVCNCGWDMWRYESKELKYCPNCGADMQGGAE